MIRCLYTVLRVGMYDDRNTCPYVFFADGGRSLVWVHHHIDYSTEWYLNSYKVLGHKFLAQQQDDCDKTKQERSGSMYLSSNFLVPADLLCSDATSLCNISFWKRSCTKWKFFTWCLSTSVKGPGFYCALGTGKWGYVFVVPICQNCFTFSV